MLKKNIRVQHNILLNCFVKQAIFKMIDLYYNDHLQTCLRKFHEILLKNVPETNLRKNLGPS